MRIKTRWLAAIASVGMGDAGMVPAAEEPPVPVDVAEQEYLLRDFAFVTSPEVDAYLQSIADKLLQTRAEKIARPRMIVYSADGFNAMADAHDAIVLSTETLRMLESEDELAALLGHELSHILLKHVEKKSFINNFPLGVETLGALATAGDQLKAGHVNATPAGQTTEFAKDSLKTSQNVSLFWSDLLAPNWNKSQEREADRTGFEMMRAAGYDPEAFATLFQKLRDAQLVRSARMEQLRQSMIQRAQQSKSAPPPTSEQSAELENATKAMKSSLSDGAINGIFDGMAKTTKDYDSPEQRQDLLAKYAEKSPQPEQDKKPRSPLFRQTLQEGPGGALLVADRAALQAVSAIEVGDLKSAGTAIAPLLPQAAAAPGKSDKKKPEKKSEPGKKPQAPAKAEEVSTPQPASSHLNFAIGKWYLEQQQADLAEVHAMEWVAFPRAPAKAFLWRASHQASRKEYVAAMGTLEEGKRRLGSGVPFLPQMVTYAKSGEDMQRAEALTLECKTQEEKRASIVGKVTSLFKSSAPTGLYADCVLRLGYVPQDASNPGTNLPDAPLKKATNALESLKN